jgi:transposase
LDLLPRKGDEEVIYLGIDWAEAHHDLCLLSDTGAVLARGRVSDGVEGVARLHEMVAEHASDAGDVAVGLELDRGLLVGTLVASGYQVYAINPLSVDRYRDRHRVSGAKSDPGDAKVLADIVRTDRHNHRQVAGDSEAAEAIKVLARAHKDLIWSRQRQANRMRNLLREYYPAALACFGSDLTSRDALAVLERAPSPGQGRRLTVAQISATLRRGGRERNLARRAQEISKTLRSTQLEAPPALTGAYAASVRALVAVLREVAAQVEQLQRELERSFRSHPDAEIYLSLPGLGDVLGARALGEFGDDRTRYADPRSRKAYAGTAPITKASGTKRVVAARFARNAHLADACHVWAFAALSRSPGARRYYDILRARGKTHNQALRQLGNRLVGILHVCVERRQLYREEVAWPEPEKAAA